MFKKSLASVVSAAVLVAGPGHLTLDAAAQTMTRGPVTGVSVTPTIGTGLNSPVPGASSFNIPTLTPGALNAPALQAAPSVVPALTAVAQAARPIALAAKPVLPAAAKAMPAAVHGSPLSVIKSQDAKVGVAEKGAALNALFENSSAEGRTTLEVLGQSAASVDNGLARSEAVSAKSPAAIERAALEKGRAAGSLSDLWNLVKRALNSALGRLGIGVKKLETPEVMAQRIIDQLNAQKPVYNRKVQEASTLVEKLRLQVEGETAKVAELEQGITALLSDSDPTNDIMASGMINQQKTLNASIASTKEQIGLADKTLEGIKEERARFFSEREEMLAKIQSGLTKSKSAEITKQIAELKGGFQIGDLKDNMDKFEDAVNDKVADAKGTVDSVESNPDQILKKAKDSLKSQEIQDEIAKRKAAIEQAKKDKGAAGGKLGAVDVVYFSAMGVMLGVGLTLLSGFWPVAVAAGVAGGMTVLTAKVSRNIAGTGRAYDYTMNALRATAIGMALHAGYALIVGTAFLPALIGAGIVGAAAYWNSRKDAAQEAAIEQAKKDKKTPPAGDDKGQAGGKLGSYPGQVYFLGAMGLGVSLIMPASALAIVAMLGILTLLDNLTAAGNLDKSSKFFAFSIGAGIAALVTFGISGFGVPFLLAGGTTILANVLGKVHKAISLKKSANDGKGQAGGLLLELGIGAAVVAVIALVSAPFRNLLARAWNATLGRIGIGVKKLETPEVMAQRIVDQLNAQKPVYNRKVQEASTLVEKLRLQIEKQTAQSQDLDRSVTAILSDSDPLNDVMAESLLNQKKTVDASTAMTQEQLALSEKTLVDIKDERARFFSEREEMLAKIQSGLTKSKSAEIQKQIAELKGGFQVGDLKDNMDKFEDAVNDKVADAKGTVDSVDSNPDQILKKAKDSLKNAEVQDEIAKRRAAIEAAKKAKGQAGGDASQSKALGYFAKVIGIGFALISPWLSAAVFSALGLVAIAMAPEQGRWLGRQLAVIGLGTLVIGGAASLAVAKLGLAVGAFGVGISFLVPAGIALSIGVIATIRASKKENATLASVAATPAGSSVMTPSPVAAPAETSAPATSSPKVSFSIKPLIDLMARALNAILGVLGMGVKKMETPEVLAQRLIDQLNAAKPVYNNKVREASTLVEKLRQQIAGEVAKIADFDKTITALLSDNDPSNDIQAAGLLNSQKTLEASVAATKEQLSASEKALENIKEERARFFSEREETLAKIQSGLTKVKSAAIQKQIAELKGGFQIGDLKDNMDRFDGAVNDKIADAKGTVDSVESNPDQVLKKAKDSLRTQEVADELAKRKAAIEQAKKDKGQAGGAIPGRIWTGVALGLAAEIGLVALLGWTVALPLVAAMGRAGAVAGFLGQISPDTRILSTIAGGVIGAMTAPGALPILLGLAAGLTVGGFFASTRKANGGFTDAIGSLFAGMLVGATLPAWLGALAAKRTLQNEKPAAGGLLLELGIGAAVVAVIALVSAPFRNLLARAWNATLGRIGIGVKKLETPEVMAQRIVDQLNAQKPVYNRKVQEASTLVAKLRLQIEKQTAQSQDLDRSVTAILSDSDPLNDVMAESLLNQKKTVDASTAMTQEQLALSEKTLVDIKDERARFFSEREEMLAKIQSGLTKSKSAEIQKQIAELKGGFQVGDLKDNMDKFEDAVNDKVADAKGTVDSVDSNPDQILKKAKDSLKNAEVQDEIAKRRAAIEAAKKAKG